MARKTGDLMDMPLTRAIEGYWLAKQRDLSLNTMRDYQLTFRRLVTFLGDPQVASVEPKDLNAFLNHLQRSHELGPKSLLNAWIALSSLWTWAEVDLAIPHAVRRHVPKPRYRRPPVSPYTEDEVKRLVYATESSSGWRTRNGKTAYTPRPTAVRDKALLITLVDTGVRASELCNLTLRDYDAKTGSLRVRQGKGRKDRMVYLGQAARRALWRYLATRPDAKVGAPLFSSKNETALTRDNLRHLVERTAQRAGVSAATVHRFRHTFAITFLRNGGNVLELQRLLGHEQMETIRIYVDLAQTDLSAAQGRASPADHWRL